MRDRVNSKIVLIRKCRWWRWWTEFEKSIFFWCDDVRNTITDDAGVCACYKEAFGLQKALRKHRTRSSPCKKEQPPHGRRPSKNPCRAAEAIIKLWGIHVAVPTRWHPTGNPPPAKMLADGLAQNHHNESFTTRWTSTLSVISMCVYV